VLRRPDIDHIPRAAAALSKHSRFVVVGTGAVIVTARRIPVRMMMTSEIEVYADGVATALTAGAPELVRRLNIIRPRAE
jgi:hypothetical protein